MVLLTLLLACADPDPADADRDGFAADDCDDANADVFPGANEFCNGLDDDCDGETDEPDALGAFRWYPDRDGDGYADREADPVVACEAPDGLQKHGVADCDDDDAAIHPGADERCDGVDEDCDGEIDDDPITVAWIDADGDGFGGAEIPTCATEGVVELGGDCDDADPALGPGATEVCNEVDDDCDGTVDPFGIWYDTASPVRVPVTVTGASTDQDWALVAFDADLRGLADAVGYTGPIDPTGLRIAQGCVEVPVQLLDGVSGLLAAGEGTDPLGDEHGAVVFSWPGTFPAGAVGAVHLYLGGPDLSRASDLVADPFVLGTGPATATFLDGRLAALVPAGGPTVLAEATEIGGLLTDAGWVGAGAVGAVEVLADGPVVGMVRSVAVEGEIELSRTWWMAAGRPELWARTTVMALADVTWSGADPVVPWAVEYPGLVGPSLLLDGGVSATDDLWGATWRVVAGPTVLSDPACAGACWIAGHDAVLYGETGQIEAGTVLVDGAVVLTVPHDAVGPDPTSVGEPVTVGLGAPEAR